MKTGVKMFVFVEILMWYGVRRKEEVWVVL